MGVIACTTRTRTSVGNDVNVSTMRLMNESSGPPKNPANAPSATPTPTNASAAPNANVSAVLVP